MPENIIDLVDKIRAVKGQEYANGLVDMANLLAPTAAPEDEEKNSAENRPA